MMNEKENYLAIYAGKQPDYIPCLRDAVDWVFPGFLMQHMATPERVDMMGVAWDINDAGPIAKTTPPFAMDDVSDWKNTIHLVDLDSLDWETMAAKDLEEHDPNKLIESMCMLTIGGCFFIPLMNMMGFSNGLVSLITDPESTDELFEYFCQYQEKLIDYIVQYYHPDIICFADDLASAQGPMISPEFFEEHLKPLYKRLVARAKSYGRLVDFHMCGKASYLTGELVDIGTDSWQSFQLLNDVHEIKEKYGDKIVLIGGWSGGPGSVPGLSEEATRQTVRDSMDVCGVGGGYIFWDGDPVGTSADMMQKIQWASDEAHRYGRKFYHEGNEEYTSPDTVGYDAVRKSVSRA